MKKRLVTSIIFTTTLLTTTLTSGFLSSKVSAAENKTLQLQQQRIIEKSAKDAEEIIKNLDKIKVISPEEHYANQIKKMEVLESLGLKQPNLDKQSRAITRPESQYLGTTGDILITPNSKGESLTGHAGIVNLWWKYTTESYPDDGVQRRTNDWYTRYSKVIAGGVKGATPANYLGAARYAESKQGSPYNWNFVNKKATDTFYCSQLVWRAWKQQGYDLDKDGGPSVAPTDLISKDLDIYYKKGI